MTADAWLIGGVVCVILFAIAAAAVGTIETGYQKRIQRNEDVENDFAASAGKNLEGMHRTIFMFWITNLDYLKTLQVFTAICAFLGLGMFVASALVLLLVGHGGGTAVDSNSAIDQRYAALTLAVGALFPNGVATFLLIQMRMYIKQNVYFHHVVMHMRMLERAILLSESCDEASRQSTLQGLITSMALGVSPAIQGLEGLVTLFSDSVRMDAPKGKSRTD